MADKELQVPMNDPDAGAPMPKRKTRFMRDEAQIKTAQKPSVQAFVSFLGYLAETHDVLLLSIMGISNLQGLERLSKALKRDEERLDEARQVERMALVEIERGFPLLYAHAVVSIWSALEAAIMRWAPLWLEENRLILSRPAFEKIKLPAALLVAPNFTEATTAIVNEVMRQTQSSLKPGIGRFTELLEVLGVSIRVSASQRRALFEMSKVRNVIVHHFGIADERFVRECPSLGYNVGQPIRVTEKQFRFYMAETCRFAADLLEACEAVAVSLDKSSTTSTPLVKKAGVKARTRKPGPCDKGGKNGPSRTKSAS